MTRWKWIVPALLGLHSVNACAEWPDEIGVELRFDDNVTRGQLDQDIKSDTALAVSAAGGTGYQLTDNSRLSLTLSLLASAYRHYHGLNNLNAGLDLTYRWKFGLGPYVPELHLSGGATRLQYQDAMRNSWLYLGEIGVSKRLSDRAGLRMAYQAEKRKSDTVAAPVALPSFLPSLTPDVFDLTSHNLSFGGDYSFHPDYVLTAAYTIRHGDTVSTTLRNLPILLASSALALDPVFGPDRYVYKMQARTHGLSLGVSRIIGRQTSFTFGYEHYVSRAEGGIEYKSNLVRATYLYQF